MLKIVTLFLIGMAVLAMFGKLHWLGGRIGRNRQNGALPKPRTCPDCGRMNLRGGKCRVCREGGND
ncbi:hypothetical protein [Gymnodinialimonas phycosphaerae]|nr:hypothetical protein [Gymnodinialimonas phycosphaerae]